MSKQRRVSAWIAGVVALLALPAASEAAVFAGGSKQHFICPGLGHSDPRVVFTLTMEPGFGLGQLTWAGGTPIEMITNWTADGAGGAFTASGIGPTGGPITLYGWTRGWKLKGWVVAQSYEADECMSFGVVKAWQQ